MKIGCMVGLHDLGAASLANVTDTSFGRPAVRACAKCGRFFQVRRTRFGVRWVYVADPAGAVKEDRARVIAARDRAVKDERERQAAACRARTVAPRGKVTWG